MKDARHKYITYRADRDKYQVTFPITVPDPNSRKGVKKKKIVKQCKTLADALAERDRLMKLYHLDASLLNTLENDAEPPAPLEEQDFSKLLLEWFETIKSRELSVSSIGFYRRQVDLVAIALQGRKLKDISVPLLNAVILSTGRSSQNSAIKTKGAINTFLSDIRKPELKSNLRLKGKTVGRREREALTAQEVKKILAYITKKHPAYIFLYKMFFLTGCRRSELLGLTWRCVDFDNNTIRIENTLLLDEHYKVVLAHRTKTAAGKRTICLPAKAIKRLKFWYIMRKASLDDFVFINSKGAPVNPQQVSIYFHKAVRACKIKKYVSLHSARHTFATNLANAGVPMYIIQKQGGWSSLKILESHYLHEDAERARTYIKESGIWDEL